MTIEEIDPNLVPASINGFPLTFIPIPNAPIELNGLYFYEQDHRFCRLPQDTLSLQDEGIQNLCWQMASVNIRFKTNAQVIGIRCELKGPAQSVHMPATGSSGFDLYVGKGPSKQFWNVAKPLFNQTKYETLLFDATDFPPRRLGSPTIDCIPESEFREFTIHFPHSNGVISVELGLSPDAQLLPPTPYTYEKPVVFYGSSITNGSAVSRPGNHYINHLSRRLDTRVVNLGFSGRCKGDEQMISTLERMENMGAFVLDYDHNAPNAEHLRNTHEKIYRRIRAKFPKLPIVIITRPDTDRDYYNCLERLEVIRTTYEKAIREGDEHVYFVDGRTLFGTRDRDACTVDGVHPNDLGFYRMAEAIEPVLRKALAEQVQ